MSGARVDGELLALVPTIQFGRKRTLHGYKLHIDNGKEIVLRTRCGIDTRGLEYTVTHGLVTCEECEASA